ncbi:MAG: hypothetical protein U5R48_12145 [Gammaproteobacteria bacterium]|nr:hypothetical protein [Gammaproteobacteria bacterium]
MKDLDAYLRANLQRARDPDFDEDDFDEDQEFDEDLLEDDDFDEMTGGRAGFVPRSVRHDADRGPGREPSSRAWAP